MKSMENDDNNNNNNKWLGFSLSPHMTMEVPSGPSNQHQTHPSTGAVATNFFNSSPHLNYGIYYGAEGENASFYSPLSMMPLKSDGSLCIMEALNRSQQPQG